MNHQTLQKKRKTLEHHLQDENPILLDVIRRFYELDKVATKIGLMTKSRSYTDRISWWPLISVMGTFSSGKSSFINYCLGYNLQRTGVQAVDDKFSVISYSRQEAVTVLPGIALDADPRFPLYKISEQIREINDYGYGGRRVDSYLQLKTCPSERLRGKILIDSPGFDADSQRDSVLAITNHIIDRSDLILVFFDARHPEPEAMSDTLEYLVTATISRKDADKFLYILNQIDVAAQEDNPEDVVASWQRSLAQAGLRSGHFYRIYNPNVATLSNADPDVQERFKKKCEADMKEIFERMEHVKTERCYRIIDLLEQTAVEIQDVMVPRLRDYVRRWRARVIKMEVGLLLLLAVLIGAVIGLTDSGIQFSELVQTTVTSMRQNVELAAMVMVVLLFILLIVHIRFCAGAGRAIASAIRREQDEPARTMLLEAFEKNTTVSRSLAIFFLHEPYGWTRLAKQRIASVLNDVSTLIQKLNDCFTDPSGK